MSQRARICVTSLGCIRERLQHFVRNRPREAGVYSEHKAQLPLQNECQDASKSSEGMQCGFREAGKRFYAVNFSQAAPLECFKQFVLRFGEVPNLAAIQQ